MKCRVEGCKNLTRMGLHLPDELTMWELGDHLRDVHEFGERQVDEYMATHSRDLWLETHAGTGKTELMIVKIRYLPDEATREGLIHVLSEVSGAIVSIEEIKR